MSRSAVEGRHAHVRRAILTSRGARPHVADVELAQEVTALKIREEHPPGLVAASGRVPGPGVVVRERRTTRAERLVDPVHDVTAVVEHHRVEEVDRPGDVAGTARADLVVTDKHRVQRVRDPGARVDLPHLALLGAGRARHVLIHMDRDVVAGHRRRLDARAETLLAPLHPAVGIARIAEPGRRDLRRGRRVVQRHRQDLDHAVQRAGRRILVVRVGGVRELRVTAGRSCPQRVRRDVDDEARVRRMLREPGPRSDRVCAAVGVLHVHRRDRLERVVRVVAHREDADALPAGGGATGHPSRPAVRAGHRGVDRQHEQVGYAVPVAIPQDRVVLRAVAREVPHEPGARRIRNVEYPHATARAGAWREPSAAGVVADERVVAPERQVRVGRLVPGREQLVHLERRVLRRRGRRHHADRHQRERKTARESSNHRSPPLFKASDTDADDAGNDKMSHVMAPPPPPGKRWLRAGVCYRRTEGASGTARSSSQLLPWLVARETPRTQLAAERLLPVRLAQPGSCSPPHRDIAVGHARLDLVGQVVAL